MDKKKLEKKLLEFLAAKATKMQGQDQESMDYSTNIEELADCTFLLENGLSDDAIFKVANSTTSGRLYDLVKNLAKPASEVRHKIIVTIEEHTSASFKMNAKSIADAMQMAEDSYRSGDLVLEPTTPTARLMMAHDTITGEKTEWTEF